MGIIRTGLVFRVGGVQDPVDSVPSLKLAFNKTDQIIKLTNSITVNEELIIPKGKKVDLNGKTIILETDGSIVITGNASFENGFIVVNNKGLIVRNVTLLETVSVNNLDFIGNSYSTTAIILDATDSTFNIEGCFFDRIKVRKIGLGIDLKTINDNIITKNTFTNFTISDFIKGIKTTNGCFRNDFNGITFIVNEISDNTLSIVESELGNDNNFNIDVVGNVPPPSIPKLISLGAKDTLVSNLSLSYIAINFEGQESPSVVNVDGTRFNQDLILPQSSRTLTTGEESNALAFANKRYVVSVTNYSMTENMINNIFDTEDMTGCDLTFSGEVIISIDTGRLNTNGLKLIGLVMDEIPDQVSFETSNDDILFDSLSVLTDPTNICFYLDNKLIPVTFRYIRIKIKNLTEKKVTIRKVFGTWLESTAGAWLPITGGTLFGNLDIKGTITNNGNVIDGLKVNPVLDAQYDDETGIMVVNF